MYKIEEKLINTILQYLGERKYVDVFQMVHALQTLPKIEEGKENKGKKPSSNDKKSG